MTAIGSDRGLTERRAAHEIASPSFADAELLANALEYFRAGRIPEAEAAYAEVLAHEPDHFVCLHHLGLIAHQRGEHAAAARLIEQAISSKPDYIEALSNLGAVYRALGKSEATRQVQVNDFNTLIPRVQGLANKKADRPIDWKTRDYFLRPALMISATALSHGAAGCSSRWPRPAHRGPQVRQPPCAQRPQ